MNSCDSSESEVLYSHACSLPWTTLMVNHTGEVSFCCYHPYFANINVKSISGNTVDEIWNGKVAQDLRKRWNEGRLKGTPCGHCEGLRRFKKYEHPAKDVSNGNNDTLSNARLNIDEFQQGKTVLNSMPVSIVYIPSVLCNISCIHCFQPPIGKNNQTYIESKVLLNFYNTLGSRAIVSLFSGGEPLHLRQTFQLIDAFSPEQKAVSKAIIQTNGLLVKDKFQAIQGFKNYGFTISITSFRKETCEYIQRGASFEKLIENLEFLVKCKSEGMDISTTLHMILMKSNFVDLEIIFEFAETYKFDEIWITPVIEPSGKGISLTNENIFKYPYLLEEIPGWKDILARASEKAFRAGYKVTYDHLEYIIDLLSFSTSNDEGAVLRSTLWKDFKLVAGHYLPMPIKSFIKKTIVR
ncbi:MAG: SPASM domain-containing protein [Desulfobacteraceae bacterium]|nr:SPASM domain-containing protein [Desulfobacteraceae bacterium]